MAIINESAARLAKQMRSFDDYKEGSATASYNAQCAEAAAILEKVKAKCATDEQRERAEYLYNRYCSVLAEAINRDNEIGTRCPSVLICGTGNFPTRKKEKQIAAWDKNMENWRKADHYLDMLKRAHTLAVKSDDPEVLDFLRAKLAGLEEAQSPSSRRAWIEIRCSIAHMKGGLVALLAEGVDRNFIHQLFCSLSKGRPPRGGRG